MKPITLVTGNKGKLTEWRRMMPPEFTLEASELDLDEIQSLDLEAIIIDKVHRAYAALKRPVIVEDIAASLDKLNGLPGPFIKFFNQALGKDALFQLADNAGDPATVACAVAYYDGKRLLTVHVKLHGTVSPPLGENGLGFDSCFVLEGQTKTYGQMTADEKDKVSHRSQAIKQMAEKLRQLDL